MLFASVDSLMVQFFDSPMSHRGSYMLPSDFLLFVNGREYNWSKECTRWGDEGFLYDEIAKVHEDHLKYVIDIERAFYDK